ncbi:DUF4382 domain-containing protein [Pyxidicoccus fallax]|uniref:DUF4382 domain-containing protein n=1 Tax=Pyxidicoccus fallax TaxID=394095 RepID=A0A848LZ54_9BACT|nr:DUF4382 domain-containing protein [Pyxidicoccus fallax]NMO22919.1 DUF4382 domain-containing protein [Pyxidicoccus fallax]NPC85886.1 DUF4382 domain-containing protein [Pyxidicoccus fallax]
MKRPLLIAPLLLAACGGGELSLSITSDDSVASVTTFDSHGDLTTVKSLMLTVDEVWVHVAAASAPDPVEGEAVAEGGTGWQRLTDVDQSFDLMTVRNGATLSLGDFSLPEGRVTQLRLKLKPESTLSGARASLPGVVVEPNGTTCDLSLPASAFDPGLKLSGAVEAMRIESGGHHRALINLNIKDSAKRHGDTCTYSLDPVLKVKRFEPGLGGGLL